MDQQNQTDYVERAERSYKLLEELCEHKGIECNFILKTGFVWWLNEVEERLERYEQDDVANLVSEYVNQQVETELEE